MSRYGRFLLLFALLTLGCSVGESTKPGMDVHGEMVSGDQKDSDLQVWDEGIDHTPEDMWPDLTDLDSHDPDTADVGDDVDDAGDGSDLPDIFIWCSTPKGLGCECAGAGDCTYGLCVPHPAGGQVCAAPCGEGCPDGFVCAALEGVHVTVEACVPDLLDQCRPCDAEDQCAVWGPQGLACSWIGDAGSFCLSVCSQDEPCTDGYVCTGMDEESHQGVCTPEDGGCACPGRFVTDAAATDCRVSNEFGWCPGRRACTAEGLSDCDAKTPEAEDCNSVDDNCNGETDEGLDDLECFNANESGSCPGLTLCVDGVLSCEGPIPAKESCDDVDNDCNGETDEGTGGATCQNVNEFGSCEGVEECVLGELVCQGPWAELEVCDGADNNCNGEVDEETGGSPCDWYLYGDSGWYCDGAVEVCVSGELECQCHDPGWLNCDPYNPHAYPGAPEVCNGIDDNCNGITDEAGAIGCEHYFLDLDEDGFGTDESMCLCVPQFPYTATVAGDCDDGDPAVFSGALEVCNGIDDNCDGETDEEGAEGCEDYFHDGDEDGFGTDESRCLCAPGSPYTATVAGDCDDEDPDVHPEAEEICNGIDDNCNDETDEDTTGEECTNDNEFGLCPGIWDCIEGEPVCVGKIPEEEQCNGMDDNCDGQTDEGFPDLDGDGVADCVDPDWDGDGVVNEADNCPWVYNPDQEDLDSNGTGDACDGDRDGDGYPNDQDCEPDNPHVHPGAHEICDGIDNNCDGTVDENPVALCDEGTNRWIGTGDFSCDGVCSLCEKEDYWQRACRQSFCVLEMTDTRTVCDPCPVGSVCGSGDCLPVTPSDHCDALPQCQEGTCAGSILYAGCDGDGACLNPASLEGVFEDDVTAPELSVLSSECIPYAAPCGTSAWNDCSGKCSRQRDVLYCSQEATCSLAMEPDLSSCASGTVCSAGGCLPVSLELHCAKVEDCDAGDCSATLWYTSCDGAGSCRPDQDRTDAFLVPVFAADGSSLTDSCDTNGTVLCNATPHCFGPVWFDGFLCNGLGACDVDAGTRGCCASSQCAEDTYCGESTHTCQHLPLCTRPLEGFGYESQPQGDDERSECPVGPWRCLSSCTLVRDSGICDGQGACAVADETLHCESGTLCQEGECVPVTESLFCAEGNDCVEGACAAQKWYTSCDGEGSCRDVIDTEDAHVVDVLAAGGHVLDPTCEERADHCLVGDLVNCTGSCVETRHTYSCDGLGLCTAPFEDLTRNCESGFVCGQEGCELANNLVFCETAENCDAGDCAATVWYTSCDGQGSCRPAEDRTDAYEGAILANPGKILDDTCGPDTGLCGYSAPTVCHGSCRIERAELACDGIGGCLNPIGSIIEDCPSGTTCVQAAAGAECIPVSATDYCHTGQACTAGACIGERWYTSCDGAGQCRVMADRTDAHEVPVYATPGNTLNASCQSNKATPCGISDWNGCASQCRQKRDILVCNADRTCSLSMGSQNLACESGQVCNGTQCAPVSETNYCHRSEECDFGDCVADLWYVSCSASGFCRLATDKTDAWVVPQAAEPDFVLNDSCEQVESQGSCL